MANNGNGAPAGEDVSPSLNALAQYIKDLSFENPNAPQSLLPSQEQPQLDVQIDVQTRTGPEDTFEVTLHIKADAKVGATRAFLIELSYAGIATLKGIPATEMIADDSWIC